jgi:type II secretory pathway pseudopilin PulG
MLLLLMFLVALMGILLAVAGGVWHTAAQRDKEAQLLFVGEEYRRALVRYFAATPPGMPANPERLEQLLLDERQLVPVRHLRRLYRDPLTDSVEWGLVKEGGRISGVYSLGKGVPIRQAGFPDWAAGFRDAKSYAAWQFVANAGDMPARPNADDGTPASEAAAPPARKVTRPVLPK